MMLPGENLRRATLFLGVATIAFGAFPLVFPRPFARLFGVPMGKGPAGDVVVRSVSARDVVSGIGILSAVMHGGRLGPWLLARTLIDGADAVAVGIAFASRAGNVRLGLLGLIAGAATVVDYVLYRAQKAVAAPTPTPGPSSAA
jgi:hypothetical protein